MSQALAALNQLDNELSSANNVLNFPMEKLAVQEKDQDQRRRQAEENHRQKLNLNIEHKAEHLTRHIRAAFDNARTHRTCTGIDEEFKLGRRLLRGEYTAAEKAKFAEEGIDNWFHLAKTMKMVAVAFMQSVLTEDDDNPIWRLVPTPIPNLPEDELERQADFLTAQLEQQILTMPPAFDEQGNQISGITNQDINERIDEFRENLYTTVKNLAERNTRNLEREVEQKFTVGKFNDVLDAFIDDLASDPIACIHGPIISTKKLPEWKDGKKVWVERQYLHYEAIDGDRVWPSEDATNPQDGTWMFYLDKCSKNYLIKAKGMEGFIAENIDILLKTMENRCRDWVYTNPIEAEMERLEDRQYDSWRHEEQVDCLKAFGSIPGYILKQAGINKYCDKDIDPTDCYEYEIWMIDNHIVRSVERVYEGARPFFCASMYPTNGSFWGKGIPHMVHDSQRKANAYDRAEVRDVGYSSGPMFEMDVALLDKSSGRIPDRIVPGLILKKNSRNNPRGGRIIEEITIASQAQYYNQLKQSVFSEAEQVTGINRQLLGQAQPGVNTLGESQLLQQNAATTLRSILQNIDKNVIEPIVEMTACIIMMTTDDPAVKADAFPKAFGSTNLLTRELNKSNLLQLFNLVYPLYAQGQPNVIEPEGISELLREIIKLHGMDADRFIVDPLSARYRREELAQAVNAGGAAGIQGNPSQAPRPQATGAGISPASIGNAVV